MLPQVLLEVAEVVKVLFTVFTNMHFLLGFLVSGQLFRIEMERADVLLQGALPRVGFTAVVAHVGFFQRAQVCFQVLFEVVVQLEATIALVAAEHVVHLGNLDLYNLDILQHLGGGHRFLLIYHLLPSTNTGKAGLILSRLELLLHIHSLPINKPKAHETQLKLRFVQVQVNIPRLFLPS